jgi:hypothetical protein
LATISNPLSLPYRTVGTQKQVVRDVALDSSYPTGGEVISPADLGLVGFERANTYLKTTATTSVNIANAYYDGANLLVFNETPAEVADSADLAGAVVRVEAYGW